MTGTIVSYVSTVLHGVPVLMICGTKNEKNSMFLRGEGSSTAGRYDGLGMDALANGCLGGMDVIMVGAWMHWPVDALVAWRLSWFGHGCTGQRMPW